MAARDFVSQKRPALFRGRHFQDVVILLCVRWYLRYSLSYRDLEEIVHTGDLVWWGKQGGKPSDNPYWKLVDEEVLRQLRPGRIVRRVRSATVTNGFLTFSELA